MVGENLDAENQLPQEPERDDMTPPEPRTKAFGRRTPVNKPAIRFADIYKGDSKPVPEHPAEQDNFRDVADHGWQMLGNDAIGDCVAVTWANSRRLVSGALSGHESYPPFEQVIQFYRTQNPDFDPNGKWDSNGPQSTADQGMVIQTALEYLVKDGGPDGVKAVAFAQVDHTNLEEVKAALSVFGGLWLGVIVTDANERNFDRGVPWDYYSNDKELGGHAILSGGYTADVRDDVKFVSWADEASYTDAGFFNLVEEAWVVIYPEHLGDKAFQEGVDLAELGAAYESLTGRPFPVEPTPAPAPAPDPTPTPEPEPTPEPTPVVQLFPWDEVIPWLKGRQYTKKSRRAADAIYNWYVAGGKDV